MGLINTGKNLRLLRTHLGLSQGEIAEKLDLKQGSYSDVERGKSGISTSLMEKLIAEFNASPNFLYLGIEPKVLDEDTAGQVILTLKKDGTVNWDNKAKVNGEQGQ